MMKILIVIAKCVIMIWLAVFAKLTHMDDTQFSIIMALVMPTMMFALIAPFYLSKEVETMPDWLQWVIKIAIAATYTAAICIMIGKVGNTPFHRVALGIGVMETLFAGYLATSTTKSPNN